jgi:hypothetical protein
MERRSCRGAVREKPFRIAFVARANAIWTWIAVWFVQNEVLNDAAGRSACNPEFISSGSVVDQKNIRNGCGEYPSQIKDR